MPQPVKQRPTMFAQTDSRSKSRSRRSDWRSNPPRQKMTYQKRKLDRVKALQAQYDFDQKWNRITRAAQNRVGEVRHLFEAVDDEDSPPVSATVLEEALDYLMGECDEKPACIPTEEEFFRQQGTRGSPTGGKPKARLPKVSRARHTVPLTREEQSGEREVAISFPNCFSQAASRLGRRAEATSNKP